MTIQQAIKQAGGGGKITGGTCGVTLLVSKHGGQLRHCAMDGDDGANWVPRADSLLADDWEVVAPDIGMRDVVKFHGDKDSDYGHVIGFDPFNEKLTIQWHDKSIGGHKANDLTLIRKAPKMDTLEGVIVHKERDGLKILSDNGDAFNRLLGNGKKYTLTLTEST